MRISDYIEQSFSNLWKRKLRTSLTIFGVVIGVGTLASMLAFGKGVQKNITRQFKDLDLFNYITVSPYSEPDHAKTSSEDANDVSSHQPLDDKLIREISRIEGVESVFPEIRFPAQIRFGGKERFSLVQVLPAQVCQSELLSLRAGDPYATDDANAVIVSDRLLRRMKVKEPETAIGQEIELFTLSVDANFLHSPSIVPGIQGDDLPFTQERHELTIVGVSERMGFGGPMPVRSDVFIPPAAAARMKKISLTSIWDFFQSSEQTEGYSALSVKVKSIRDIEPVKTQLKARGLRTFALIDQLQEIKTAFLFMDMFLLAVGMIAIVVASLGIINTMVMSILERFKEIGIMKAVGASNKDVKKIFFFEAGVIGFLGGVLGLALGWSVGMLINQIINHILAKRGVPHVEYFSFPWWLCAGAILFSILVSLAAGIYPTIRAARVDPVVALRHE